MAKKQTERETLAESLKRMAQTDIRTVDKNTLVERSTVKLDPAMSREERILSFIEQIKNPYCYLDDGVVVKVSFMDTDVTWRNVWKNMCGICKKNIFIAILS